MTRELPADPEPNELVELWSQQSGIGPDQMTINLVAARQGGAGFGLMAFLYLPSLWSAEQVRRLQLGLAGALSNGFGVPPAEVQIVTSIVEPGLVVEAGEIQEW